MGKLENTFALFGPLSAQNELNSCSFAAEKSPFVAICGLSRWKLHQASVREKLELHLYRLKAIHFQRSESGNLTGNLFICFESEQEAEKFIAKLSSFAFPPLSINGLIPRFGFVKESEAKAVFAQQNLYPNLGKEDISSQESTILIISQLDPLLKRENLVDLLYKDDASRPIEVSFAREKLSNQPLGFAFVHYSSKEDCKKALNHLNPRAFGSHAQVNYALEWRKKEGDLNQQLFYWDPGVYFEDSTWDFYQSIQET